MNLKVVISVVMAAIVIAAGALAFAVAGFLSPAQDDALDYVPADAAAYVNFFLDPSGPQKLALDDLLGHFPQAGDRAQARDLIVGLIDRGLEPAGLRFDDDIDPWLGSQIAFFFSSPTSFTAPPPAATLIATEDPGATLDAVDDAQAGLGQTFAEQSYEGADYETDGSGLAVGVVDDFLVTGTEAGFKAVVDAHRGSSLGESDRYREAVAGLSEDRLALGYFDVQGFAALSAGAVPGGLPGFGGGDARIEPSVSVVYARPNGLVVESSSGIPEGALGDITRTSAAPSEVLPELPADSWAAIGIADLGKTVQSLLGGGLTGLLFPGFPSGMPPSQPFGNEFDIDRAVGWMGDAGIFVRGDDPAGLDGGLVVRATDPAAADRGLDYIRKLVDGSTGGSAALPGDFSIDTGPTSEPIYVYRRGDSVVAAYGDDAARAARPGSPSLGASRVIDEATALLGDGFQLNGFVALPDALALVEALIPDDPMYRSEIKPWLDPLSTLAFGSKLEGDRVLTRAVLEVE